MAEQIIFVPFAIAILTALFGLVLRKREKLQAYLTGSGMILYLISTLLVGSRVFSGEIISYQVGGWMAPFGITFVADALSGFMLTITAIVALTSFIHAWKVENHGPLFLPLISFMLTGVTGAFLTGDIFNLFVWFEVTLMSSYILVAYKGGKLETKTALQYLSVNLIGSSFMLVAIGGIYSTMGTLNMADLSRRFANPEAFNASPEFSIAFFSILFCVFALKAGLAPFQFWVPDAYRAAPNSVSSLLSGIAKKVGIYAIIRLYLGVLSASALKFDILIGSFSVVQLFGIAMLNMAALSIIFGGLGALSRDNLDSMLAYSSIGQVGFIFVPLGLSAFTSTNLLALTASLIYILNHALAKSMLFQFSGILKNIAGSAEFEKVSGLSSLAPILSGAFFIGMISLIGIPPTLGFFGKLNIFSASMEIFPVLALALVGGILTILYFTRAWSEIHWGESTNIDKSNIEKLEVISIVCLALLLLIGGLGFEFIYSSAEIAAENLINQETYRNAVLENITAGGHS